MNTMKTKLTEGVHCFLDSARGIYIPRDFARSIRRDCIAGVKPEDLDYLAKGPDDCLDDPDEPLAEGETWRGEFYWDTWTDVCDNAIVTDPESGLKFRLHQDGDLFLVSADWEWDDNEQKFIPPESDTLMRFELPEFWASYLINGDSSGIEDSDQAEIDDWLKQNADGWTCTGVSASTWFARSNDASNLGGTVARYTFVRI